MLGKAAVLCSCQSQTCVAKSWVFSSSALLHLARESQELCGRLEAKAGLGGMFTFASMIFGQLDTIL